MGELWGVSLNGLGAAWRSSWADALLIVMWETAIGRLAGHVQDWPTASLLATTFGHVLIVGGAVGAGMAGRRTALDGLGTIASLLTVLAPAIALLWPMMVLSAAPEALWPDWLWALPLPGLFATLAVVGMRATGPAEFEHPAARRAERLAGVAWLILCEAVIASAAASTPRDARIGLVATAALVWVPSRLLVMTDDQQGRASLIAALVSSSWILVDLALGGGN